MPAQDTYRVYTDRIIALLEQGTAPWHQPWNAGGRPRKLGSKTLEAYRGANIWLLGSQRYASPLWGSLAEINARGGHVLKGEKATPVVFGKVYRTKEDKDIFVLKHFPVFNVEQCRGLDLPALPQTTWAHTPLEHCAKLVGNYPQAPSIVHGGDSACYSPSRDVVSMPDLARFPVREHYYSTLFHELTHSTGHASRLGRSTLKDMVRFGDIAYAKEELIAEMGATYLCGLAGIANETVNQSAAYLKGWLRAFESTPKILVEAASAAQKAVDFILGEG